MRNLFDHHFTLKSGAKVYVPTEHGRIIGRSIKKRVERLWTAPRNYYHLRDGGHIAAARIHENQPLLASMDLKTFFEQISRSRVQRSLVRIGIPYKDAFNIACDSVVDKSPPQRDFSIPFGFVQSPLLASVALAHSALGAAIRKVHRSSLNVSVYVDDITISGDDKSALTHAMEELCAAAEISDFRFNDEKTQGPSAEVSNFNLRFGSGRMEVIAERMAQFELTIRDGSEWTIDGILGYVDVVNQSQADLLRRLAKL